MTTIEIANNTDDDLGSSNFFPSDRKANNLQPSHYISKNSDLKSVSEDVRLEIVLQKDQASMYNVSNNEQAINKDLEMPTMENASSVQDITTPTFLNVSREEMNKTAAISLTSDSSSNSKTYTCSFCCKEFKKEKNFKSHNCKKEKVDSKVKMNDNVSDSSKIYISCIFCKKGFKQVKNFKSHDCRKKKSNSNVEMHKCEFCSLTFSQKTHLNKHMEGHTRNNCTLCNAQFTKRKALCKHLRIVHHISEPEKLYQCPHCDKYFPKRLALNFHLKSHINNKFSCLTCCFMCDDENTYNDHLKQHVKVSKYECNLCHKKFVRQQQYDQHMMAHEKYSCSSCDITFSNKKLFLKHQHSVHHIPNEKKHACHICQKLFVSPKHLQIHQRVHTGEKPVKCSHCEKHFYDSKSLHKHMKRVKHLQRVSNQKGQTVEIEKPFLCATCGVRFYCKQSLERHIKIIHSATEFSKCPHCDYKSKCETNFKRHLELHTDIKRFICEICGLSFRALATLNQHYVFVHSENREFICEICKKGFKNNSTLQRHMRIHSENRPYKCYCNRDYKRMSHLKRHMINAHKMTVKKNKIPITVEESLNSNSSLSEENVAALIKSLEALPDESSCDDFSLHNYIVTMPSDQMIQSDFPASHYTTLENNNHTTALRDLDINDLSRAQLITETRSGSVPLNSMQSLSGSCDASIVAKGSENTLNAVDLNEHMKVPPTTALPNSETSSTSLDDATLSLSPSNYCNASSPLNTSFIENIATLSNSVSTDNVHPLTTLDNNNMLHSQSSANLNFEASASNVDSFVSFSNSDSFASQSAPPFSLNSSPSHVTDLNLEQNSQRQLFGVSDDFLSLTSYASFNGFDANYSPEHFFNWDTDENSSKLKIPFNDLVTTSTCANISASLTDSVNNSLPNNLFTNDSIDVTYLRSELDSLSNLC